MSDDQGDPGTADLSTPMRVYLGLVGLFLVGAGALIAVVRPTGDGAGRVWYLEGIAAAVPGGSILAGAAGILLGAWFIRAALVGRSRRLA